MQKIDAFICLFTNKYKALKLRDGEKLSGNILSGLVKSRDMKRQGC